MIQIFVKTNQGQLTLDVEPDYRIADIKQMIFEETNIVVNDQRLIYNSKALENDYLLIDYQITKDASIDLVQNVQGGI